MGAKYHRDPDAQSPAGGVSSTVRDLAQWLRLQLGNGKQVIDAEALAETHRPQMASHIATMICLARSRSLKRMAAWFSN
jgi:CubicO group peptidase (beta-lactamase class C family)